MVGPTTSLSAAGTSFDLRGLRPLLGELNDLKRIRVAGRVGSLADQGFVRSWVALLNGEPAGRVACREAASALASSRLGGIDAASLRDAGLAWADVEKVLRSAIAEMKQPLGKESDQWIEPVIAELWKPIVCSPGSAVLPEFIGLLQNQPRAGATRPGWPRLVLEPPENHAEHCYITAIYAVLLAPLFGANQGVAFLASLAHHFHNAYLPDSGFTGEELLGEHLVPIMERYTNRALEQLPADLEEQVRAARSILPSAETAAGQAFHAGDVFDRVLQMEQYSRVAAFETRQALVDLDLVHPGPLQKFHQDVLGAVGLLP